MKHTHGLLTTVLLLLLSIRYLAAQIFVEQPIDMTWGWYWKGITGSGYDYTQEDLVDQIIYDNGIYFVGRTAAPQSSATFANCATTVNLGNAGDAYIAHRDLCGNTWTTYFGCSTAREYAYCLAEDKVGTKKFSIPPAKLITTVAQAR